jgi:hypothetical protein
MGEKRPRWTVCCNLVSPESDAWVGTSWEFFNTEDEAAACFKRHQKAGDCPTKRPFYAKVDVDHMGVADRYWLSKLHESVKR